MFNKIIINSLHSFVIQYIYLFYQNNLNSKFYDEKFDYVTGFTQFQTQGELPKIDLFEAGRCFNYYRHLVEVLPSFNKSTEDCQITLRKFANLTRNN